MGIRLSAPEQWEGNTIKVMFDSDWAGDQMDRKSVSGHFGFVGNSLFFYQGKTQATHAMSSAEAELAEANEADYTGTYLSGLNAFASPHPVRVLYGDNAAANSIAERPCRKTNCILTAIAHELLKFYCVFIILPPTSFIVVVKIQ